MDVYRPADGHPKMKAVAEMKDGQQFGVEENFFAMDRYPAKEDLEAKFRDQFAAYGKIPKENADRIISLTASVDTLEDIRELTELFY